MTGAAFCWSLYRSRPGSTEPLRQDPDAIVGPFTSTAAHMTRLSHPPSLAAVYVHAPRGAFVIVFAVLAVLHAVVGRWVLTTVGEPYRQTVEQNERLQATASIVDGIEDRNLLVLQSGLERAADIVTFNETLFDEGKALHRQLSTRINKLTAAAQAGDTGALVDALELAIEVHSGDGRPIVDRRTLRSAAKKLQELAKAAPQGDAAATAATSIVPEEAVLEGLYGRVKAAIDLSRDLGEAGERVEEDEKKLVGGARRREGEGEGEGCAEAGCAPLDDGGGGGGRG